MDMEEKQHTKETRVVFSFRMEKQNGLVSIDTFELPKHTRYVRGIQLLSDYPDRLYYRGKQRIEIGGEELFPDGFESKILMSSLSVAPRERFFELGDVLPGDLSVKVRFEDTDHTKANFDTGYMVTLILLIQQSI
ncbi:hypothetical protein NBT05_02600 [Aquimarina sp. ERC-38]|uniref:hypothetical protein n=1 Tax=Aquimarina sp. ERC-38 TaxID=2949996 RepID=UPI002246C19F|nr:hypothetical protein [Aquimarina sp. ERC-38]UZO81372.1 hypothetical protein NBT05_02600 [Aquimarina sp. ERC-38]